MLKGDEVAEAIVLAEEDGVDGGEADVLVDAAVAGEEEAGAVAEEHVVGCGLQLTTLEFTQTICHLLRTPIHLTRINPRCYHINIRSNLLLRIEN